MDKAILQKLLQHKPVEEMGELQKKFVSSDVDYSMLNEEQLKVFTEFIDLVENNEFSRSCIRGYAGTGKTFLTTKIIEKLLSKKNIKVCLTAPTNKAVKVLRDKSNFVDVNLKFSTIHSLLGLEEKIMPNGEVKFVNSAKRDIVSLGDFDIIVVDEVSMLNNELLVGSKDVIGLLEVAEDNAVHLLFVGDPKQIPPVNSKDTYVFSDPDKYDIKVWELNNIVRQSKGSPIIDLTLKIRKRMGLADALLASGRKDNFNLDTSEGVAVIAPEDKDALMEILHSQFTSDNFKANPDYAKVIAFTNKTVGIFNQKIRSMIYGVPANKLDKIYVGEKLFANSPIVEGRGRDQKLIVTTNSEFEVESYSIEEGNFDGAELTYYHVNIFTSDGDYKSIKVIHEKSEEDLKLILDYCSSNAKKALKGSFEAMNWWGKFYEAKRMFADIGYNYAITAHKSQGSTYETAFVVESDIDIQRDIENRNRIKYTAFTRPSKRLVIII